MEVKWIKTTKRRNSTFPEELLFEEEVERVIGVARHPRDKALIFVLYELDCRIGELLTRARKVKKKE